MAYTRDFDTILSALNDAMTAIDAGVDVSQGAMTYIKNVALAAAIWGLYNNQDHIATKPFPDLCNREDKEHWASLLNIPNYDTLTDVELLTAISLALQKPESGGNKYDWPRWAREVAYDQGSWDEAVNGAELFEGDGTIGRYPGSIDLAITSDRSENPAVITTWVNSTVYAAGDYRSAIAGAKVFVTVLGGTSNGTDIYDDIGVTDWQEIDEWATDDLVTAVSDYIEDLRPVGLAYDFQIRSAQKKTQDVTIAVTGATVTDETRATMASTVTTLMKSLATGKTLFVAQLESICVVLGAESVITSVPGTDTVTVTKSGTLYERIWPGTITIN